MNISDFLFKNIQISNRNLVERVQEVISFKLTHQIFFLFVEVHFLAWRKLLIKGLTMHQLALGHK